MREKDTKKEISLQEKHIYQRSKWISWLPLLIVVLKSQGTESNQWFVMIILAGLFTGAMFLVRYLTIDAVKKGTVNKRRILINAVIGIAVLFILGLIIG